MEIAQVGVRTRAQAALAMGAATSPPTTPKRRKINKARSSNEERKLSTASSSAIVKLGRRRRSAASVVEAVLPEAATEERCSSPNSGEFLVSCCCSNGSVGDDEERIELSDLEVESAQVETSTCNCGDETERREMNHGGRDNSQELESVETDSRRRPSSTVQNMPTELELEEFFAAAEKDIQKRFQEKYNYDIGNDVPLEGRYEWVELKP
ncbi:hypothetical protein HN873_050353 [Arachis hypogaea]|uniref:Cyclin-dependent kinase inhibitor n=1 Tax=Arachis hypogaea TaxID=3818 RepID=A0A444ZA54_ARAHY|nr:Cyclin-dependent kinase inhibitor [Arachis hypogaea]RYR11060.1 hypothetical protein Ahy_B05g079549 isoform A [Arachis hypogaea]